MGGRNKFKFSHSPSTLGLGDRCAVEDGRWGMFVKVNVKVNGGLKVEKYVYVHVRRSLAARR